MQRPAPSPTQTVSATRPPGTFQIARLAGIPISVHWSWPLAALLIAWVVGSGYVPDAYPQWSDRATAFVALATAGLFFGSVLLHEFGHAIVGRRLGYPVEGVTLYLLGGATGIHADARRPRDEFLIAGIGPAVSVVIAVVSGLAWAFAPGSAYVIAVAGYVAISNGVLAVFNLLPGLPLDGGRILRAAVWAKSGSYLRATSWASRSGQGLGIVLVGVGAVDILFGSLTAGVWSVVLGWFIWSAARTERRQSSLDHALEGLTVDEVMERHVPRLTPDATLRDLALDPAVRSGSRAFLVSPGGTDGVLGMVTLTDVQRAPRNSWEAISVYRAMTPVDRLATISPEAAVRNALQLMATRGVQQVPVFRGRDCIGLVTQRSIASAVALRQQAA